MKRTKMILILSTLAICGTASVIYYFYRRNKNLLNEVKKLKKQAWANEHRISTPVSPEAKGGAILGPPSGSIKHTGAAASRESLNSLRNEIDTLEEMISSSEEDTDSSSYDVDSEALLKDILGDSPDIQGNVESNTFVDVNDADPEINPLRSYHLDDNEDNDNLELRELMGGDTNTNIETIVQENISKAVVNITTPSEGDDTDADHETVDGEKLKQKGERGSSINEDATSSDIIEISNMSSQSSVISDTLTLEMKIEILLDKYSAKRLVDMCSKQNISKSGSKRVLVTRLIDNNYNFNLNKISGITQELNNH